MGGVAPLIPARGRDLAVEELETLVARVAARADLWTAHVRHEREHRHYVELHRDREVDLWLICWDAEQETGLHDHDRSSGAVRILAGTLLEDWLAHENGVLRIATRSHGVGDTFSFDATHIHDVRHDGGPPAVSLHAYSPALEQMGHYAFGPKGLGRMSRSYIEEVAA